MIEGKYTGLGVKKTPAYETPLSKHDVQKWRKEFWETRTNGNKHIWTLIKNACEEDHETAELLIKETGGLKMPQNSLTLIIDAEGIYYRVPICLINDPVNYDADYVNEKLKQKTAPKQEATINVNYCTVLTLHLESTSALDSG